MTTLDLTGVLCPLNWVKARVALERMAPGEALTVLLDPGQALENVPRSALDEGHEVAIQGTSVRIVKR